MKASVRRTTHFAVAQGSGNEKEIGGVLLSFCGDWNKVHPRPMTKTPKNLLIPQSFFFGLYALNYVQILFCYYIYIKLRLC